MYIYDNNKAVQQKLSTVPIWQDARLNDQVVHTIQGVMENHYPFAAAFKHMYEVKLEEDHEAEEHGVKSYHKYRCISEKTTVIPIGTTNLFMMKLQLCL